MRWASPSTSGKRSRRFGCRRSSSTAIHLGGQTTGPLSPHPVEASRYVAERIPGARFVCLTPGDPPLWAVDQSEPLELLREFLTGAWEAGAWEPAEPDRVLATLLFTDLVGSTEVAAELGDARWRDLVHRHHAFVRQQLVRFRGREIDTAGDGFFASFDGPARAVRCACAIVETVPELGLDVRAGLHTGECELIDGKPGGWRSSWAHASLRSLRPARCSPPARSRILSPGRASCSRKGRA